VSCEFTITSDETLRLQTIQLAIDIVLPILPAAELTRMVSIK